MNKTAIVSRAITLEAKLDKHLFGVYRGEDGKFYKEDGTEATGAGDFKTVGGAVKGAAVVGATGGGLLAGRKLAKRYGADQVTSPGKAATAVGRGVVRDVVGAGKSVSAAVGAKTGVAAEAFRRGVSRDQGKFAKRSLLRGVKGAVAAVTGGRVKFAVQSRLIELAAK